jgi:myo-inositol 2-dehydrogenase/D-chiro-inositol 1-dehydrogenase
MRRYDEGYRAMKSTLAGGTLGAPLLIHCAHRNAATPPHFTSPMLITDAAIHEIDLTRWLLDEEIAAVRVFTPRRSSHSGDLDDPQVVILETVGGVLVDIEVFVNCSYGYDIRCELVAEGGTIALADASASIVSQHGMRSRRVPSDWRERFVRAYDAELQVWLESVAAGSACGPSVWDGYAATAVAEACLKALETAQRTPVELVGRPALYEPAG